MKTQEQIIDKFNYYLNGGQSKDFFGVKTDNLLAYLNYENAKEFLKDGVTKKERQENQKKTDKDVRDEMKDYLSFAYEKAEDERGLSANRSIDHYLAWSWLVDDELHKWIDNEFQNNYHSYGIEILKHVKKWLKTQ